MWKSFFSVYIKCKQTNPPPFFSSSLLSLSSFWLTEVTFHIILLLQRQILSFISTWKHSPTYYCTLSVIKVIWLISMPLPDQLHNFTENSFTTGLWRNIRSRIHLLMLLSSNCWHYCSLWVSVAFAVQVRMRIILT